MINPVEERSGSVVFRPRARLIRLLGEELISDEVMAVVEIVKNSYDADATSVELQLLNVHDVLNGSIQVRDDGCGMSLDTVLNAWMEPATPYKKGRSGVKQRTSRGRIQLGEKGVGRFAADKLGSELELISRQAGSAEEVVVTISWHYFDHDRYLDEVESRWSVREPVEFTGEAHGTLLLVRSLRTAWDLEMIKRLQNGLARLVAPSSARMDFGIVVDCPDFPQVSGLVKNQIVDSAPYRLRGHVDSNGVLMTDSGTSVDLRQSGSGQFITLMGELRRPRCGPFSLVLNAWDLEPLTGNGFGVDKVTREMIKASSGISIYRDGFRVWPYGEKDDDWLELNQRRVNNPTLRMSNNQVIGFVEITHGDNPDLRDRTSREGLIDNQALFDLKALVLSALAELEMVRFTRRHEALKPKRVESREETDEILQQLSIIKQAASTGEASVRMALQEMERLYRERMAQEQVRYNHVSRLAGLGMAAEMLTDAFSREVLNAMTVLKTLEGQAHVEGTDTMKTLVHDLGQRLEKINEQLDLMGPLYRASMQDDGAVVLRGAVYDAVALLGPRLVDAGISVTLIEGANLRVRMNRAHLIQILIILLENALQAIQQGPTKDRQIAIEVLASALRISDSGPGLQESVAKLIFQPHYSTRHAGRGLGLHVARDILAGYNSTLDVVRSAHALAGACFQVKFDRRRCSLG